MILKTIIAISFTSRALRGGKEIATHAMIPCNKNLFEIMRQSEKIWMTSICKKDEHVIKIRFHFRLFLNQFKHKKDK